ERMRSAYGRACTARSCARRILDAATSSMARVTCAVLCTDRMRSRIARTAPAPAIASSFPLYARNSTFGRRLVGDAALELLDGRPQLLLGLLGELPGVLDRADDLGVAGAEELVERLLEVRDLLDRHIVQHAAHAGEQDRDLLRERLRLVLRLLQQL